MNVYETCPEAENQWFLLRQVSERDCADLLKVYSDPAAVPLFNSDNCNGDDFNYTTMERMQQALQFWIWSYDHGWFVRWGIVDKATDSVIGTVELCRREGKNSCILRVDLRSDYENETELSRILPLIVPDVYGWFGCDCLITKAKPIAKARINVLTRMGFVPADSPLLGHDGTQYGDYYVRKQ